MIDENGANKKAAKKHFHVGDVGVGVVGDCFSHLSGCFIVAWACRACNVGGLLPELRNRKKPHKPVFTGHGR